MYLEVDPGLEVLAGLGVVDEVEDGGKEGLLDAGQVAGVEHVLGDGSDAATLTHQWRILQGCNTVAVVLVSCFNHCNSCVYLAF